MLKYRYKAYVKGTKEQAVDMAINGSGIRDTRPDGHSKVSVCLACEEAEIDEQWSFVSKKSNQRWLWYAIDHATNTVLA